MRAGATNRMLRSQISRLAHFTVSCVFIPSTTSTSPTTSNISNIHTIPTIPTQAIELSAETLGSVKLVQEKKLLQGWFDQISQDTGKYCFMVKDTLAALELGAVETLIGESDSATHSNTPNTLETRTLHELATLPAVDARHFWLA